MASGTDRGDIPGHGGEEQQEQQQTNQELLVVIQQLEQQVQDGDGDGDADEFVSAEGSSNIAEEAVNLNEVIIGDSSNNSDQVGIEAGEENIDEDQDDNDDDNGSAASGEDLVFNVVDAEDALLLNEQQPNGLNDVVVDDEEIDEDDDIDDDEDVDDDDDDDDDDEEIMEEEGEEAQEILDHPIGIQPSKTSPGPGCSHYRRGCSLIAPCCGKQYACRHCHNENEAHEINRFAISEVVCLTCAKRQPITDRCIDCASLFGNYVCLKCRVWDMDFKGQWHCDGCGICRLGGKDHFFHCDRCGYCLSVALRGDHRCIERATRTGCAICLSDLHDTRTPLVVPACGHPVHRSCWRQMIDSRRYFCPTCRRAVVDLTDIWADLDNRIGDQLNRLPAEFSLPIFCNDCQQHSSVRYNIIGYYKCPRPNCGSYNTSR